MSVTIIRSNSKSYTITVREFIRGKAYEDENGDIYIANSMMEDIRAFSLCGSYVADDYCTPRYFREVNLTITVEN